MWGRFSRSHRRFYEQSISASAVYIDPYFVNEKEKCSFARPPEFIKSTWKRGTWGASLSGGQPHQVKGKQISWFFVTPNVIKATEALSVPEISWASDDFRFHGGRRIGKNKSDFSGGITLYSSSFLH